MQRKPEAVRLSDYTPSTFLIDKVNLTLDLGEETTYVHSRMEIARNPASTDTSSDLELNGDELELMEVQLNGEILTPERYEVSEKGLRIFNLPSSFTLTILNKIHPNKNTALSGLYVSKGNFCTQCEPQGFRRITYFLDRPDVMAKYTTKIIADAKNFPTLLSNGNIVGSGKLTNDRHWVTWEDPIRKSSYLFAMVAGDYEVLKDKHMTKSGKDVSLEVYCERGYSDRLQYAMQTLKNSITWDEKKYNYECKWNNYKLAAVTDFNMGAMENPGLNIFNAVAIYANMKSATDAQHERIATTISHETFHSYTGDEVGIRDPFQLFLKEGLTTSREQQFSVDQRGVAARIDDVKYLRNYQFPEDEGPLAHSVQPQSYIEIDNFYTATVYMKGAEIFHMMHVLLGEEVYKKGMQVYYDNHHGKSVTVHDYVKAMEIASGKNLSQFALWYTQVGTPVVDVTDEYDPVTKKYFLTIKQSCNPPMMLPIKMGLLDCNGKTVADDRVLTLTQPSQTFVFDNIASRPVPSLLRGFSAPVKLNYAYSDNDLQLLARTDTDDFNRWEASQRYVMKTIQKLMGDYQAQGSVSIPDTLIQYYKELLTQATNSNDLSLLALMLTPPTENEIANEMKVIDVNAICAVRKQVMQAIAKECENELLQVYVLNHDTNYSDHYINSEADQRRMKAACLAYLMSTGNPEVNQVVKTQFDMAKLVNMTDTLSAMALLASNQCTEGEEALETFYQQWKSDPTVILRWFQAIASAESPQTLQRVKSVMENDAFNILNPTHVRFLIRSFIENYSCFHAASGEGYAFLTDLILKLDSKNPGVAADFAESYSQWRKFASPQREMMQQQLRRIMQQPKLSNNLYEIASKSLGEEPALVVENAKVTQLAATLFTSEPKTIAVSESSDVQEAANGSGYNVG